MPKSIDLLEIGLKDGRYTQVSIDSDLAVTVRAVYIREFRQEPYENNGAIWMSYYAASLDPATMRESAGDPKQEFILSGQHLMDEVKKRFFPFDIQNYDWLCGFESLGGRAFFQWNEEPCPETRRDILKPRLARGVQDHQSKA